MRELSAHSWHKNSSNAARSRLRPTPPAAYKWAVCACQWTAIERARTHERTAAQRTDGGHLGADADALAMVAVPVDTAVLLEDGQRARLDGGARKAENPRCSSNGCVAGVSMQRSLSCAWKKR